MKHLYIATAGRKYRDAGCWCSWYQRGEFLNVALKYEGFGVAERQRVELQVEGRTTEKARRGSLVCARGTTGSGESDEHSHSARAANCGTRNTLLVHNYAVSR